MSLAHPQPISEDNGDGERDTKDTVQWRMLNKELDLTVVCGLKGCGDQVLEYGPVLEINDVVTGMKRKWSSHNAHRPSGEQPMCECCIELYQLILFCCTNNKVHNLHFKDIFFREGLLCRPKSTAVDYAVFVGLFTPGGAAGNTTHLEMKKFVSEGHDCSAVMNFVSARCVEIHISVNTYIEEEGPHANSVADVSFRVAVKRLLATDGMCGADTIILEYLRDNFDGDYVVTNLLSLAASTITVYSLGPVNQYVGSNFLCVSHMDVAKFIKEWIDGERHIRSVHGQLSIFHSGLGPIEYARNLVESLQIDEPANQPETSDYVDQYLHERLRSDSHLRPEYEEYGIGFSTTAVIRVNRFDGQKVAVILRKATSLRGIDIGQSVRVVFLDIVTFD